MTHTSEQFVESDIRPADAYATWRDMVAKATPTLFADAQVTAHCPGCGSDNHSAIYDVDGIAYHRCGSCSSLFAGKRPTQDAIDAFYGSSDAALYWKDHVVAPSLADRKAHYVAPLQAWVQDVVREAFGEPVPQVVEYMPSYYSNLAGMGSEVLSVLPKHMDVLASDVAVGSASVLGMFDVIDRVVDPKAVLQQAASYLKQDGVLCLTVNTGSGFEYQVLGNASHRLVLPDRLNLLSIGAIERLLEAVGFEVLELSTPGKLDMSIIEKTVRAHPEVSFPHFITYLLSQRNGGVHTSLQSFIQLNNLGSFVRIAARKK